jgi:peroxiredoxin
MGPRARQADAREGLTSMVFMQHLLGRRMPNADLEATSGSPVNPARIPGPAVIFCYPFTGRPGHPNPPNWDDIPGAHGSTPQALAYSEAYGHFRRLGVKLFGLSMLASEWQRDFVTRNKLTYRLLSDESRTVQSALGLPMFETGGALYLQRLTFILQDGIISAVRFPIPEPEKDAAEVLAALS